MAGAATRGRGVKSTVTTQNGNVRLDLTYTIPEPPTSLKPVGQARWYQIADIMVERGTWSLDWIPALEHMCRIFDQAAIIDLAISKLDSYVSYSNQGVPKTHPLITERLKLDVFLQNQLNCFNLTPVTAKASFLPALGKGAATSIRNTTQIAFQDE